jgi:hypothetical protein
MFRLHLPRTKPSRLLSQGREAALHRHSSAAANPHQYLISETVASAPPHHHTSQSLYLHRPCGKTDCMKHSRAGGRYSQYLAPSCNPNETCPGSC